MLDTCDTQSRKGDNADCKARNHIHDIMGAVVDATESGKRGDDPNPFPTSFEPQTRREHHSTGDITTRTGLEPGLAQTEKVMKLTRCARG